MSLSKSKSRSCDFRESQAVLSKEVECQFIRESFQEIIRRKDRLLIQKEKEINDLKKQLRQNSDVIHVHSHKPRVRKSRSNDITAINAKEIALKRRMSAEIPMSNRINTMNEVNDSISGYIEKLQKKMENDQTVIRKLTNKIASYEIKLEKKANELQLLQREYNTQSGDKDIISVIEQIVEKAQSTSEKEIILDQSERITINELLEKVKQNVVENTKSNHIDYIAGTMQQNVNILRDMLNKYECKDGSSQTNEKERELNRKVSELLTKQMELKRENNRMKFDLMEQRSSSESLQNDMKLIQSENISLQKFIQENIITNIINDIDDHSDLSDDGEAGDAGDVCLTT